MNKTITTPSYRLLTHTSVERLGIFPACFIVRLNRLLTKLVVCIYMELCRKGRGHVSPTSMRTLSPFGDEVRKDVFPSLQKWRVGTPVSHLLKLPPSANLVNKKDAQPRSHTPNLFSLPR